MGRRNRQSLQRNEQDVVRRLIAEMRNEAGLSQRELSRRLRANETLIARIERGERTVDLVEFIDIMAILGVEPLTGFQRLLKAL